MTRLTILGPQRKQPCVAKVLDDWEVSGHVAVVSAGWEEREGEHEELAAHVGRELVGLGLYPRAEVLYEQAPELLAALRERTDRRHRLREMYQLRLEAALDTVYALVRHRNQSELMLEETTDALAAVAALDDRHVARMAALQEEFEEQWKPEAIPAWADACAEVATALDECEAIAIAGGHVGVLLDRLRLFGIPALLEERKVVAWSAGAMACMDRVVLFHDTPPQGRGHAEIYAPGLGLAAGMVALPHARSRLLLDNTRRLSVLARRLAPATCLCLEEGDRADWDGKAWSLGDDVRWFDGEGVLHPSAYAGAAS